MDMLRYRRASCVLLMALMVTGDVGRVSMAGGLPFFKKSKPKTCLERAAIEVDRLERELNQTGTVAIKAPDIWGESRLTKHRQEFEREMEKQITEFQLLLNANIRRSDQAFLSQALAIQAAVGAAGSTAPGTSSSTFVNSLTSGTVASTPATVTGTTGSTPPASEAATSESNLPIARTNIYTGVAARP